MNNIIQLYFSMNKNYYLQLKNNIQKILNIEYSIWTSIYDNCKFILSEKKNFIIYDCKIMNIWFLMYIG